ncbi:MAG: vWA domain-containing protein [Planctomycetota bacterium]
MLTICCEKCGAGVSVDPNSPPKKIKCPQCHSRVTVPAGLAALPSPKVPGSPGVAAVAAAPEAVPESEASVMMARFLPWLASACLHGAGALMLVLALQGDAPADDKPPVISQATALSKETLAEVKQATAPEKLIMGPPTAGALTGPSKPGPKKDKGTGRTGTAGWFGDRTDKTTGRGWGPSNKVGEMIAYGSGSGGGGGAGGSDDFGMGGGGDGGQGGDGFFGNGGDGGGGGNVKYVCYVIDHSGSVLSAFDEILEELKSSIGGLHETQDFHVVFFAKDAFQENPTRRLVPATDANKRDALGFLREIRASGYGSSPIPALDAAFKSFRAAPNEVGKGKLMYVLTDGDFDTSAYKYKGMVGNDAVTQWLRDNNGDKMVHVYPIILGEKPGKETEESMRKIASENGGEYRFVERKY